MIAKGFATSMATPYKQDLPPRGGFTEIPYMKYIPKRGFSGYVTFGIYIAVTATGFYIYGINWRRLQKDKLEQNDGRLAMYPFHLAERHRSVLKTCYRNRETERELMKNVEGWEVGTLWGEELYQTIGDDYWLEPKIQTLWTHTSPRKMTERGQFAFML